ncbi:hypothetical protein KOR34_30030 [Posidoniimonas corsicana]|uniref:DUF1269 domain-containing protein n=1 Tax=Posidoniimonas corsicana TaxID=1938618 RepID=A0A5C5VJP7_9BACT|nr:hypothetical protein [Posidoniimonas corsicana]TWT38035.1 hypothetical protein KOR34_30030 [Posidoniimonas corsicana]
MQPELEEATRRDGMIAVFEEPHNAEEAYRRVHDDPAGIDVRLISNEDEVRPILLTPREPQVTRAHAIAIGVAIGATVGLAAGLLVGMAGVLSQLPSFAAPAIGAILGVLVGSTTAGLGFPPYRDDSEAELSHYIENGNTLLLALGNRSQLKRVKRLIRRARPATLIEPSA